MFTLVHMLVTITNFKPALFQFRISKSKKNEINANSAVF